VIGFDAHERLVDYLIARASAGGAERAGETLTAAIGQRAEVVTAAGPAAWDRA